MRICHAAWTMTHGEKVAEPCARRGIPHAWQLRRKREGLSLVHGSKIRSRRCRTIKLVYQYLWKANLVQRGSTHFMYIIERIPSKNPRFSKPEALVWHTRNHLSMDCIDRFVRFQTEQGIDVNNLTTNVQDPCGHPGRFAPLLLNATTPGMVMNRWGDGC